MYCSNCGDKTKEGSKFCASCGKQLMTEQEEIINAKNEETEKSDYLQNSYGEKLDPTLEKQNRKNNIGCAAITVILLMLIIIPIIIGISEDAKNRSCADYIDHYMRENGWGRPRDRVHTPTYYWRIEGTSKLDSNRYIVLNTNAMIFGNEVEGLVEMHFNNDEIFFNENYDDNMYEEYKDELNYYEMKKHIEKLHNEFERVGCPVKGKLNNIMYEEYNKKNIESN